MNRLVRGGLTLATCAVLFGLAFGGGACGPIEGSPPPRAPENNCAAHPCDTYAVGKTVPRCSDVGRCEFQGERPLDGRFTIVVQVPDSSYFAPGQTFVMDSSVLNAGASGSSVCVPPLCLSLPNVYNARGVYRVKSGAAASVGVGATDDTAFPAKVVFVPLQGDTDVSMVSSGLPAGPLFASSTLTQLDPSAGTSPEAVYVRPIPAGRYVRAIYPEAPFDEFLPPSVNTVHTVQNAQNMLDVFTLGSASTPLDDPSGILRTAGIERVDGLEGFSAWLADGASGMRISSRRSLNGKKMQVRLDTVGQSQTGGAVRDNVDVVVAPPEGALALPTLRSRLFSGAGLEAVTYPALPPPASVTGVVAVPSDGGLRGVPGRVTLASTGILTKTEQLQQVLHYTTSTATDDSGGFATVVPPGSYDVIVEPREGTGFAKTVRSIEIRGNIALSLEPNARSLAHGRAVLSDGRPLSGATVFATPASGVPLPRPATTRTDDDGEFRLELDRGTFDIAVVPVEGTGFPRVVTSQAIAGSTLDLGTLTVPVPMRLAFTLREPSQLSNPIVRAVVRIFAPRGQTPDSFVEVGVGMTDATGRCEILLADRPH